MANLELTGTCVAGLTPDYGAFGAWQVLNAGVVFKTALLGILQPLTHLQTCSVVWELDPDPMVSPSDAAIVKIRMRRIKAVGVDEHRYGDDYTLECGQREVMLTFRAEAYDYEVEASEILNRIIGGLWWVATGQALNAIGLAYQKAEGTADFAYTADTRVVNVATCDIRFNGCSNFFNEAIGTIASVDGNNIIPGTLTP